MDRSGDSDDRLLNETVAGLRAELRRAERQARVAERIKSEFLINMSHELRTPMNAVLGFVDLLIEADDASKETRQEHLFAVRRNARHLMRILSDIFDLTRFDSGDLTLQTVAVSPWEVMRDIASHVRPMAHEKGIGFDVTLLGSLPGRVETDARRLRQILLNLAENAVRYTDCGGVRIMAQMVDPEGARPKLRFDVADTGRGLSPEALARVFEPFTQADGSSERAVGGAGLGLTIATHMTSLLGGRLRAESIEGHGSVFQLTIDPGSLDGVEWVESGLAPADTERDDTGTASLFERVCSEGLEARVLYVEDSPDNRRLVCHILRKVGLEVSCAENGALGVEAALNARDAGQPFDLILMDLQMPVMDGYRATRRLREEGWSGPIVALTAHALSNERQRVLEAGCDRFVTKPVNRDELIKVLSRQLREHKRAPAS